MVAYAHFVRRDYPLALTLLRQANALGPPFSTFFEIEIYTQNEAFDEASAELDRLIPGRERDPYLQFCRAMLFAAQKRSTDALAIAATLEETARANMASGHLIARIHLASGDRDRAFEWMNRALDAGAVPNYYKDAPLGDSVRTD